MTEYIIVFILLLLGILVNKSGNFFTIIALIGLFLLGILRSESVGTDVKVYYDNFVFTTYNPNTWNIKTPFEPGFNYMIAFYKSELSDNYMLFVSLLFAFTYYWTIKFYYSNTNNFNIALFIFFTLGVGFSFMNIMRQSFAFAIALPFLNQYLRNRHVIIYFIAIIAISFLFHTSTILFLIFPILLKISKNDIKKTLILFCVIISYILSFCFQDIILSVLNIFSGFLSERYFMYFSLAEQQTGFTALFWTIFVCVLLFFYRNKKLDIFFLAFIFGVCLFNILSSFSIIAPRASFHLLYFAPIVCANLVNSLNRRKRIIYIFVIVLICFVYFVYVFLIKNTNEIIPYTFRF